MCGGKGASHDVLEKLLRSADNQARVPECQVAVRVMGIMRPQVGLTKRCTPYEQQTSPARSVHSLSTDWVTLKTGAEEEIHNTRVVAYVEALI